MNAAAKTAGAAAAVELFVGSGSFKRFLAVGVLAGGTRYAVGTLVRITDIVSFVEEELSTKGQDIVEQSGTLLGGYTGKIAPAVVERFKQKVVDQKEVAWDVVLAAASAGVAYGVLSRSGWMKKSLMAGVVVPIIDAVVSRVPAVAEKQ